MSAENAAASAAASPTRLALASPPVSVGGAVALAEVAESEGLWGVAFADTAPRRYQDVYVSTTACLLATRRVRIGPLVTNPVSRHWSVHAASARSLEELAPGRFFVGISAGDGAVRSVGLAPARWPGVEESIGHLRANAPTTLEVHVAASGRQGTVVAGRVASDFTIGVGLDVATLRAYADRAREARAEAGIEEPLRVWTLAPTCIVPEGHDLDEVRERVTGRVNGLAHFALTGDLAHKGVPDEFHGALRERLRGYDYQHHGSVGTENPNARLLDGLPDIQRYLVDRMVILGTARQCRARLETVIREGGLDGVWISAFAAAPDEGAAAAARVANAYAGLSVLA